MGKQEKAKDQKLKIPLPPDEAVADLLKTKPPKKEDKEKPSPLKSSK